MYQFVTVYIMCYNSEKTVIETLKSVNRQTHNLLDLIISDDASKDSTLKIVQDWIIANRNRFRNIRIIHNEQNKGINYTYDNAIKECKTKWVKIIAGDDILFDDCVEKSLRFAEEHSIDSVLFSQDLQFWGTKDVNVPRTKEEVAYMKRLCKLPPKQQYKKLLKRDIYFSPTSFIHVDTYKKLGGVSIKIKNIEDTPLALMFTSNGYSLNFMDDYTVYYRIGNSVSHRQGIIYNPSHIEQTYIMKHELIYPNISKMDILYWYDEIMIRFRYFIIIKVLGNKDTKGLRLINNFLRLLSLSSWKKLFEKAWNQVILK